MANYYIPGVWKTAGAITHILFHTSNSSGSFNPGKKVSETFVIGLVNATNEIRTILWDYNNANWKSEALVAYETLRSGKKILRSHRDGTVTNNLYNLIDFDMYVSGI